MSGQYVQTRLKPELELCLLLELIGCVAGDECDCGDALSEAAVSYLVGRASVIAHGLADAADGGGVGNADPI